MRRQHNNMQGKRKRLFSGVVFAAAVALMSVGALAQGRWEWKEAEAQWYYYEEGSEANQGVDAGENTENAGQTEASAEGYQETTSQEEQSAGFTGWVDENGTWYYVKDSRMMTGWIYVDNHFYFLKTDGTMAANEWAGNFYCGEDGAVLTDTTTPDGVQVDVNGSRISKGEAIEPGTPYLAVVKANPDGFGVFGEANDGQFRVSIENGKYCYKAMDFYAHSLDLGGYNPLLYSGDAFINPNAVVKLKGTGNQTVFRAYYMENPRFRAVRLQFNPAGYITYLELQ